MYCVHWKTRNARLARKSRALSRPATGRSWKPDFPTDDYKQQTNVSTFCWRCSLPSGAKGDVISCMVARREFSKRIRPFNASRLLIFCRPFHFHTTKPTNQTMFMAVSSLIWWSITYTYPTFAFPGACLRALMLSTQQFPFYVKTIDDKNIDFRIKNIKKTCFFSLL